MIDGIYPLWATFVSTISNPVGQKKSHFAQRQVVRKEVERAFGVLQAHFTIIRGPTTQWDPETLWKVMTCCVIMHNMIADDVRVLP